MELPDDSSLKAISQLITITIKTILIAIIENYNRKSMLILL